MNTTNKVYVITENVEDHTGYNGQPVTISQIHEDGYVDVTDGFDTWYCGVEEIQEIKQPSVKEIARETIIDALAEYEGNEFHVTHELLLFIREIKL